MWGHEAWIGTWKSGSLGGLSDKSEGACARRPTCGPSDCPERSGPPSLREQSGVGGSSCRCRIFQIQTAQRAGVPKARRARERGGAGYSPDPHTHAQGLLIQGLGVILTRPQTQLGSAGEDVAASQEGPRNPSLPRN